MMLSCPSFWRLDAITEWHELGLHLGLPELELNY